MLILFTLDCDGNDPKNPLGWKHGGTSRVNPVLYHIIPTKDHGYMPGTCTFHLQEDEKWSGMNTPGYQRTYTFDIEQGLMKDGAGNEIGRVGFKTNSGDGDPVEEGDGNPLNWQDVLPDKLQIISEANAGDYVQFYIGTNSWKAKQGDQNFGSPPGCNVGGWSSSLQPHVSHRSNHCLLRKVVCVCVYV